MTGTVELQTPLSVIKRGSFCPGMTVQEIFDREEMPHSVCLIFDRDGSPGVPVLHRDDEHGDMLAWSRRVVGDNEAVVFFCPLEGDRAMIRSAIGIAAVLAAVVFLQPELLVAFPALTAAQASGIAAVAALAVSVGVNLLLPDIAQQQTEQAKSASEASPTYSLGGQGNQARLGQPIPRLYGRHIIFPDFAAQPWTTFVGNEFYLNLFFCLGLGEYDVEEIRIGDTSAWKDGDYTTNFTDIQLEVVDPNQIATLFHTAVHVSQDAVGQELRNTGIGGSGATACLVNGNAIIIPGTENFNFSKFRVGDLVAIEFDGGSSDDGNYTVGDIAPGGGQLTVRGPAFIGQGTRSFEITLVNNVGPFAVCLPGKIVNKIEWDVEFRAGLYFLEDNNSLTQESVTINVQIAQIDSAGNIGALSNVGDYTYSRSTRTPQRFSESITAFGPGRYALVLTRITPDKANERSVTAVQWTGLKGFIPHNNIYPDATHLSIKVRAGGEVSAAQSHQISVIETAKLPIWNGSTWSAPTATRSPAWALADIRRSAYGEGKADSTIDLDGLLALDATWAARDDTFDGVFDTSRTITDAKAIVALVGRGRVFEVAGIMTVIRDEPRTTISGVFSPRNIQRGSAQMKHVFQKPDTPDDYEIEFLNEETWKPDVVRAFLPGSTSSNTTRTQAFGIVKKLNAWQWGMYSAASNTYRRRLLNFQASMEAKILLPVDLVYVSIDFMRWGQSGDIVGRDGNILELSEYLDWSEGSASFYLILNKSDNSGWGPVLVTQYGDKHVHVELDAADLASVEADQGVLDSFLKTLDDQTPTRFSFGGAVNFAKPCRIVSIAPQSMTKFDLQVVVNDDRVYTADEAAPPF